MFHSEHGLFFKRLSGGDVWIVKTTDGLVPREDNIDFTQTLTAGSWCSAVCNVSADGEENGRWYEAMRFHGSEA